MTVCKIIEHHQAFSPACSVYLMSGVVAGFENTPQVVTSSFEYET